MRMRGLRSPAPPLATCNFDPALQNCGVRRGKKAVLTNCRILVVEDEPLIAMDLVAILAEEHGKIVASARSVAHALEL
jgi:hypothetical protein